MNQFTDCATGFLSSISTELVKTIVKELRYPCCFNNFVEDLKKEEGNLIATRDSVQDRVKHAKEQTRKPAEVVEKWLNDTNIEVDNVKQLLEEASTEKHYCVGHCPNWIWRYQLGKKLAKKKLVVENHLKEPAARDFIQLERIATLPSGLPDFLKEKCFNFESRQVAYDKVMEAMKDDEVSIIGLYGMGGCGKTTLAMEVGKVAEAEHLFDKVLFVPVSSTVEIRRIQEKIASSLQYTFPENEERERAKRLRQRLTQEKRILVILDDVWQMLNFGDIGVPSREDHKELEVSYENLKGMGKLRVLILENADYWKRHPLSTVSFKTLANLRYMMLVEWKLSDISFVALIICGASELQQVFEVPKLKLVVLVQVPRFCQGNELQMQNVKHRFVLNSPNLTSTVHTIEELKHKLKQEEIEDFHYISDYTWAKIETEAKKASESGELPSPQELVDDQSMTRNESSPTNQPMAAAETETIISIPQNIEIEAEREPLSSEVIDNNQSIQRNITGREHEQKRIEREELVSESYNDFLELDREGKRAPHLQPSKQKLSPMSSPENIKETGKEKIQEKAAPEGGTIKSLAAGVDGISLGGGVATHTEFGGKDILAKDVQIFEKDDELNVDQKIQKNIDDMIQEGSKSNLADKERRTSVVCNDGVEIPPAFADTGARLGAYKQFVDLDDAQIALLAEAVEAYPHLWNVCNKYSERFQALTVKTLADMLLFLRNESAVSVTPQREKDFHGLCDEAVQLGFDRSWIDQMRQRVVVAKDPKLDDAQTRIRELHMRHAHLTQELHKIKNELKNLQEFVDAQTKCFNFL
ncbi:hypothetical protein RJT34_10691 [Clitoria ternatea]|uniref:NB-ARC domain-containing protein n=1 Tax=Clitoria ternatea TaxID=43366 RepID=A0AAN9JLB5_CLITE